MYKEDALVLSLIIVCVLTLMFLSVTLKLMYLHYINSKKQHKMYPENVPQIRRDSGLLADLETFHLKTLHRFIISVIQPSLIQSHIDIKSSSGGFRESDFEIKIDNPKVAPKAQQ